MSLKRRAYWSLLNWHNNMDYKYAYKYKIIKTENRHGHNFWYVKRKSWIGLWFYLRGYSNDIIQFKTEESAYRHIESLECQIREDARIPIEVKLVEKPQKKSWLWRSGQ